MTTENDDLIKRLRTYAPNNITRRAADMFEALQAERDALQAKLTALEKQEPVVWRREWEGDVSDLDSWLYIEDEADKDELPWQSLYPAAGAAQPASAAVPEELTQAALDVISERRAQIEREGWTTEHDDKHTLGEMQIAAACLCVDATDACVMMDDEIEDLWGLAKKHRGDRRRQLVIAGALTLATIESIDRASHNIKEQPASAKPLTESFKRKAFEATKADPKSQGFSLFNWFQSGVYLAEAAHNIKEQP